MTSSEESLQWQITRASVLSSAAYSIYARLAHTKNAFFISTRWGVGDIQGKLIQSRDGIKEVEPHHPTDSIFGKCEKNVSNNVND